MTSHTSEDSDTDSSKSLQSFSHIPSIQDFLSKTDTDSREHMRSALADGIAHYLYQERPVYLDGFGILFNEHKNCSACRTDGELGLLRTETQRRIVFEKCDDPSTLRSGDYTKLVLHTELARTVYARLPISLQIRWTMTDFSALVRRIIRLIREETVMEGVSHQLSKLGVLYAFHSRQGRSSQDWFAGADMYFSPAKIEILSVSEGQTFRRPVFENAFEPLKAAYGKPLKTFQVDLAQELVELGYDRDEFERSCPLDSRQFQISVFLANDKFSPKGGRLIYCSNGVRFLCSDVNGIATEMVFQLALGDIQPFEEILDPREVPLWPSRVFTLGWIMLHSRPSKTLKTELGISIDRCIAKSSKIRFQSILTTTFNSLPTPQRCSSGEFQYVNLLGLAQEEIAAFGGESSKRLSTLLQYRGLDQMTRLKRPLLTATMAPAPHSMKGALRANHMSLGKPSNSEVDPPLQIVSG